MDGFRRVALVAIVGLLTAPVPAAAASSAGVRVFKLPAGESIAGQFCFGDGDIQCSHELVLDASGALWFPSGLGELGRMDLAGHFAQVSLGYSGEVLGLTRATDGGLWFNTADCDPTNGCSSNGRVGRLDPLGGGVGWYTLTDPNPQSDRSSTLEPDEQTYPVADRQDGVWLYSQGGFYSGCNGGTYLIRLDAGGGQQSYPFCAGPWPGLAIGPDGSPWFGDFVNSTNVQAAINRLRPDGSSVAYPTPGTIEPAIMTVGSGNVLWFAGNPLIYGTTGDDIVRFEPDGTSTIYRVPGVNPSGLVEGPDGAMWMTDYNLNGEDHGQVWRLDPGGGAMLYSFPQFAGVSSILDGPDGGLWLAAHAASGDAIVRLDPAAAPDACIRANTFTATSTGMLVPRPVIPPPTVISIGDKEAAEFTSNIAGIYDKYEWAVKLGLVFVPGIGEELTLADFIDPTDELSAGAEIELERIAEDPPDPRFRRVASARLPSITRVRPGRVLTPALAAAINRLNAAEAQLVAYGGAMVDAVQRSQGAAAAASAAWVARQDRAAARYGKKFAGALRAVARARGALARALGRSRLGRAHFSAGALRRALLRLRSRGLPGRELRGLRRLGFSSAEISRWVRNLAASPSPPGNLSSAASHDVAQALDATAGLSGELAAAAACAART